MVSFYEVEVYSFLGCLAGGRIFLRGCEDFSSIEVDGARSFGNGGIGDFR